MKQYIYMLLLVLLPHAAFAEALPEDAQRLSDDRAAEIAKIDEKYTTALERLKDSYTKSGDLESALQIAALIAAVGSSDELVGSWVFLGDKGERRYHFLGDGTVRGQFAVSGGTFSGKWRRDNQGKLQLTVNESVEIAEISLTALGGARIKFESGHLLKQGRKVD